MKFSKEYIVKGVVISLYVLPFLISYVKKEKISFSGIYYWGFAIAVISLINWGNEVINNWLFALTLILVCINLFLIGMYFFM